MTPLERAVLWIGAIVAVLAAIGASYNFVGGRELTTWSDSLQAWSVAEHADHGGPPDHIPPPPPPPPW